MVIYGQSNKPAELLNIPNPSATAGALGEYVDVPVGYFTGVPSISIPVTQVTEGPLSLNVSLSYHAGGVRLGQPASWTGLGWALNAGGIITRTRRGRYDESFRGWLLEGDFSQAKKEKDSFIESLGIGAVDGEPDLFTYNFSGYTGKFYFDGTGIDGIVSIPQVDTKFEVVSSPSNTVAGFKVTVPNGTKYFFGVSSATNTTNSTMERAYGITTVSVDEGVSYGSSWYLKRIESADGLHDINL